VRDDFKLISLSIALWVGAAGKGLFGTLWLLALIPIVIASRSWSKLRNIGPLLLIAILVGTTNLTIHQIALSHNALHRFIGQQVRVVGTIQSDPHVGQSKVIGSFRRLPSTTFLLRTSSINGSGIRLPIRISTRKPFTAPIGTLIAAEATVVATKERTTAALLVVNGEISIVKASGVVGRATAHIRGQFRKVVTRFRGDGATLLPGLVLGDTSLESPEFINQMRRTGLTHLTAVSGENFAIISAFILWLSQWFFKSLKVRTVMTALALVGFIFLVRPSPSVLRASVMTAALLLARVRGDRGSALPSLGLAIATLLLIDPFQSIDPGFALSVGATAGILILSPILKTHIPEVAAIPISATLFCTPVIIAISGQFPLMSLPANIAVTLAVAPITITGFIAALISPLFPTLSYLLVASVLPFAQWIAGVAHQASRFPVISLPGSFLGTLIASSALYVLYKRWWKTASAGVLILIALFSYQYLAWPGSNWLVANCDVGQGDGAVINLGEHQGIVVDTGPDPVLMDKCLKDLHVSVIPLLIISHSHADHAGGIEGAKKNRKVGAIWTRIQVGEVTEFDAPIGHVRITPLWPNSMANSFESMPGDGSAVNNQSIALIIDVNGFRYFTGGDIEPPAQEAIVQSGLLETVDLIKVSHHGSAYQYLPMLDALHPKVAFISVGKGNTYGHPAFSTLNELENRHIDVHRTDREGTLIYFKNGQVKTKKKSLISLG
jgi:competence protein ComEC